MNFISLTAGTRTRPNFFTTRSHLHRVSGARPVSALSHPETTGVKRLTPAVVLRIWVILGNSRVIMGTVLYMFTYRTFKTTTNCGLRGFSDLYRRTVIVCRH